MKHVLKVAAAMVVVPFGVQISQAGVIYTTRASYDAAVAGYSLAWSEDFESFAQGAVAVPTVIGDGAAEIMKEGTALIEPSGLTLPPSGNNEWFGVEAGLGETIQGLLGGSLGINAIGFDYFSELGGSYNFVHSGGVDSDVAMPSLTALFVGWVGAPGEVLDFVNYTPGNSAHRLDDFVAHSIPGPPTVLLIALGLGCGYRRRRRGEPEGARPRTGTSAAFLPES